MPVSRLGRILRRMTGESGESAKPGARGEPAGSGRTGGPPRELVLQERQVQAINRFPDQNPNPVMRMSEEGHLLYANLSSEPIRRALGVEVGDPLPADVAARLRSAARDQKGSRENGRVEVEHEHRTYALLPVDVRDLGFINIYGTDITAQKAIDKFPAQNPHPVLRTSLEGVLIYANAASTPIVEALGLRLGDRVPAGMWADIRSRLADPGDPLADVTTPTGRIFTLLPVLVAEFSFVNLYGTEVTAARAVEEANRENERLLLNILPPPIADRLRAGEKVIADRFDDVTMLIADVVGFTQLSSGMSASEVVGLLNHLFTACDALVDRHGLEKVKTTGDAYMVVGGLPTETDDHIERVADLALDLAAAVSAMQADMPYRLTVRMGMHSGPVVAGVVGSKKFIYDVWGNTVNTASRMESLSVPGRIQVTHAVYMRLRDRYRFEPRGVIDVKGLGPMQTYFLLGRTGDLPAPVDGAQSASG
jgi:class 3 adenylate cyclase